MLQGSLTTDTQNNRRLSFLTVVQSISLESQQSLVSHESISVQLTLVQRANAANGYQDTKNLNNAPATRTVNSDRSLTYTATIEGGVIHTRVYPNGSCLIQSVASSNGTIVFEEYGRIGGITPQPAINPLSLQPIQPAIVPPSPTQQKPQVLPPGPTQTTPPTKLPASPAPIQPRPAITETHPAPSPR